jgi:hypothetical protein
LRKSTKPGLSKVPGLTKANPLKKRIGPQKTSLAILEYLQNNDPDGVMGIILIYLEALHTSDLKGTTRGLSKFPPAPPFLVYFNLFSSMKLRYLL